MKKSLLLVTLLSVSSLVAVETVQLEDGHWRTPEEPTAQTQSVATVKTTAQEVKAPALTKITAPAPTPVAAPAPAPVVYAAAPVQVPQECVTSECGEVESVKASVPPATIDNNAQVLTDAAPVRISVTGQGVSPMNTNSPAQAYALAKRAAVADAYRMIAEKVKGVRIDGQDTIKNMMVKRSEIRTSVNAMVRNANVVETTFKDGLCEVEMEILLSHSHFAY